MRGVAWSALNAVIPAALNGAVFIVTSRFLGPAEFGLVALAMAIVMFANAFSLAAFAEALVQKHIIRRSHVDSVFWLILAGSGLLYLGAVLSAPIVAARTGQPLLAALIPVLGVRILLDNATSVPSALISRSMAFHLFTMRTAITSVISGVVCIALIAAGFGIWAIVVGQLAASAASCVASYWSIAWRPGLRVRRQALRDLGHYGLHGSANRVLQMMSLDQIILGAFAGTHSLGIFNFSRRLFQLILDVVGGALSSVTHTLFASMQTDAAKTREAFLTTTLLASLGSFPAFAGLAAVAPEAIVLIFGDQWSEAVFPVRCFCLIGLIAGIGVVQASAINSLGKPNWWFYYQLLRNVLTVATIWFGWPYGIDAIVLAMAVQAFALWPLTLFMVSRLIDVKVRDYARQFVAPLLASVALLAAVGAARALWPEASPGVHLIAEVLAGATAYAGVVLVLARARIKPVWHALMGGRGRPEIEG